MPNLYVLNVYDWSGHLVHIFDSWRSLDYNLKINDNNDLTLTLQDTPDANLEEILVLDYLIEVKRNCGFGWYTEDYFFIRTAERALQENGTYTWICFARGLNDLLDRRWVSYASTTLVSGGAAGIPPVFRANTKSSKNGPADNVMKSYVEENCGPSATTLNGRFRDGVFPNFIVGANISAAPNWEGSRAYKNLLVLMQEIGKANSVDFYITYDRLANQFVFTTAYPQAGNDLTATMLFRPELGNMAGADHTYSRTEEATAVLVNGQGQGDERLHVVLESIARYDSPYNTREVVLDQRNAATVASLTSAAEAKLNEVAAQHSFKFTALDVLGFQYGHDFKLADRVSVGFKGFTTVQKLVQAHINMSEGKEQISLTFGDYMAPTATIVEALRHIISRVEGTENSGDI
jgi:hypothetical protein